MSRDACKYWNGGCGHGEALVAYGWYPSEAVCLHACPWREIGPTAVEPVRPPARQPAPPKAPSQPPEPPKLSAQPGSLLKWGIWKLTRQIPGPSCSCNKRALQMNEWGWTGCFARRDLIAGWLTEEAQTRGHDVDHHQIRSLLRAAWREVRRRSPD